MAYGVCSLRDKQAVSIITLLLHIVCRVCQWKNFPNQLIIGEDIEKSKVLWFFMAYGICSLRDKQAVSILQMWPTARPYRLIKHTDTLVIIKTSINCKCKMCLYRVF